MGCFLGCLGGSKERKRRTKRNKVIPRDQPKQRHGDHNSLQSSVSIEQDAVKEYPPTNLVSQLCDKPEEQLSQLSSSTRKRVTFDSNVTEYEHVSVGESVEYLSESKEISEKEKEESLVKLSKSESEDDSVMSSVRSYPPNHRYQNCRDSDDEAEEFGDSDLEEDVEDDEEDYSDYDDNADDRIIGRKVWSESVVTASMESRIYNLSDQVILKDGESPTKTYLWPNEEVNDKHGLNRNARDRSDYVHPVLNPVENLSQWKKVKSDGALQFKSQKENITAKLEALRISFSSEPTFKHSSSSFKPKSDKCKTLNQEIAMDASLSTWLAGPESSPAKTSLGSLGTVTCEKVSSTSQGSISTRSIEDRPILGALTVEEQKQLSACSSSQRSPSRSPDERPIIGTVGTYWNGSVSSKDSRSASFVL